MNLLNITGHIQYSFAHRDQNSFKKSRRKKSNSSSLAFDVKTIAEPFKVRLQITSEKEFDFRKNQDRNRDKDKKPYKSKAHAYTAKDKKNEMDYYDFSHEDESNEKNFAINHENENSSFETFDQDDFFVKLIESSTSDSNKIYKCKKCRIKFSFNNKLHEDVRDSCKNKSHKTTSAIESNRDDFDFIELIKLESNKSKKSLSIITSKVDLNQDLNSGFGFREYQYAIARLDLFEETVKQTDCLNTDADLIIMNKSFFLSQFKESIRIMTIEIIVRDIDVNKHKTKKYVICFIFFRGKDSVGRKIRACLRREIHLVEGLKVNILIDIDVLIFENFVLDFQKSHALINSCDVIILI